MRPSPRLRWIIGIAVCCLLFVACTDAPMPALRQDLDGNAQAPADADAHERDTGGTGFDDEDRSASRDGRAHDARSPAGIQAADGERSDPSTNDAADRAAVANQTDGIPVAPQGSIAALPDLEGQIWRLVDRDDFTGDTLDRSRWDVYDNAATNGVSRWSPENVAVAGGQLLITGRGKNRSGSGNVAGGLCWCGRNGNQTYGMWRVRARLERGAGYGQAFLLWPQSDRWPQDGELDFAEIPNAAKNEIVGVVHWGTPPSGEYDDARHRADLTAWHTYTVVWVPGVVRYYIDDTLFYDSLDSDDVEVPDDPMHLALQVEPGPFGDDWVPPPNRSTPDEVITHIDWVELYR